MSTKKNPQVIVTGKPMNPKKVYVKGGDLFADQKPKQNKKNAVLKKVKATLLEGLKKDGLMWFKPWKSGMNFPINNKSGRAYRGFNNFILNAQMLEHEYKYNEWDTFKSISARGGKINKGESGTDIYFWLISYCSKENFGVWYKTKAECMKKEQCEEKDIYTNFDLRYYRVWNIGQCEGLTPKRPQDENAKVVKPIKSCENIVAKYKKIAKKLVIKNIEQDRAYYSPMKDLIVMPLMKQFKSVDKYYHTLFHEMVHSTGHDSRLNREGVATANMLNKTKNDYAFEELIAESGAMVLSGIAGIETKDESKQSQAYVNGWVKAVEKADEKAIVSALTQSAKATDYILGVK